MTLFESPRLLDRDGDLLVLYKPSGLPVHPTNDRAADDLLSWARRTLGCNAELALCHRLDKQTSGLVLCSESPAVRAQIGAMFAATEVRKEYCALVYGQTEPTFSIGRPMQDARRGVMVHSHTDFEVEEDYGGLTLLKCYPKTGRKHQIRRHLARHQHPIVGDKNHGYSRPPEVPGDPGRLWLHALSLTLPDGRSWHAPLATELQVHKALLDRLAWG